MRRHDLIRGTPGRHGVLGAACSAVLWVAAAAQAARPPLGGMDTDRDGLLTPAEHTAGARAMFVRMDSDHDDSVTAQEMTAAQAAIRGEGAGTGPTSAEKIAVIDGDGDGRLTAEEHAAGSKRMFTRMDEDGDGRLTPAEFDAGHAVLERGAKEN